MPNSTVDITALDDELRPILKSIGERGMLVHEIRLEDADAQLRKNVLALKIYVEQNTGIENVNSLAQIKKYLEDAGYPTKSVAAEVLNHFEGIVPHVAEISKLRKYSNLQSKLRSFASAIDIDGRVRFDYRIDHGTTGRLYVTDFNLQQLPAVGRHCILPDWDKFVVFDFKQFDLRILTADSGEPNLVETMQAGIDPYVSTAAKLFNVGYENVTKEQRNVAKVINLAVCYGGDTRTVSSSLGVTSEKATETLNWYYRAFPDLRAWTERIKAEALATGSATSRFNRRMVLDFSDRRKALRQAVAMRGQGGAADVLRQRLVELSRAGIDFSMTVHDSVLLDVDETSDTVARANEILTQPLEILEGPYAGQTLPLEVTIKEGKSWGLAAHREELEEDYYDIRWKL